MYIITNREVLYTARSITIIYDSKSAIYTSAGLWRSKTVRQLATIAQGLYETVQQIFDVEFFHISSHTGHPMNELADSICTSLVEGRKHNLP